MFSVLILVVNSWKYYYRESCSGMFYVIDFILKMWLWHLRVCQVTSLQQSPLIKLVNRYSMSNSRCAKHVRERFLQELELFLQMVRCSTQMYTYLLDLGRTSLYLLALHHSHLRLPLMGTYFPVKGLCTLFCHWPRYV